LCSTGISHRRSTPEHGGDARAEAAEDDRAAHDDHRAHNDDHAAHDHDHADDHDLAADHNHDRAADHNHDLAADHNHDLTADLRIRRRIQRCRRRSSGRDEMVGEPMV
jgi:hypothetical protein